MTAPPLSPTPFRFMLPTCLLGRSGLPDSQPGGQRRVCQVRLHGQPVPRRLALLQQLQRAREMRSGRVPLPAGWVGRRWRAWPHGRVRRPGAAGVVNAPGGIGRFQAWIPKLHTHTSTAQTAACTNVVHVRRCYNGLWGTWRQSYVVRACSVTRRTVCARRRLLGHGLRAQPGRRRQRAAAGGTGVRAAQGQHQGACTWAGRVGRCAGRVGCMASGVGSRPTGGGLQSGLEG